MQKCINKEKGMSKVYIKIDEENNVIDINSNIFIEDLTGWILIDEGNGDKYTHAQGNYLPNPLLTNGEYNYKYEDNHILPLQST